MEEIQVFLQTPSSLWGSNRKLRRCFPRKPGVRLFVWMLQIIKFHVKKLKLLFQTCCSPQQTQMCSMPSGRSNCSKQDPDGGGKYAQSGRRSTVSTVTVVFQRIYWIIDSSATMSAPPTPPGRWWSFQKHPELFLKNKYKTKKYKKVFLKTWFKKKHFFQKPEIKCGII